MPEIVDQRLPVAESTERAINRLAQRLCPQKLALRAITMSELRVDGALEPIRCEPHPSGSGWVCN